MRLPKNAEFGAHVNATFDAFTDYSPRLSSLEYRAVRMGGRVLAGDGHPDVTNDASRAPRLLVIDDDNLHRMIICRAAAKSGYVPVGAANHREAVKLSQEGTFDCVTLDITLGDRGGAVTLLRHLASVGCKAPIIVVSGCDDDTLREIVRLARSLKLNVAKPVPKPVDLSILRRMLDGFSARPSGTENAA